MTMVFRMQKLQNYGTLHCMDGSLLLMCADSKGPYFGKTWLGLLSLQLRRQRCSRSHKDRRVSSWHLLRPCTR